MPRIVLAIVALVLTSPLALAEPVATAGVGPDGLVRDEGEPYYLLAHASAPEAPHQGKPTDDCAYQERPGAQPPPLQRALVLLAQRVADWDPVAEPRISGWYPTCFSATFLESGGNTPPMKGVVSYDFASGRYFVATRGQVFVPTPVASALPTGFTVDVDLVATGTTGVGTLADCETCPPPP